LIWQALPYAALLMITPAILLSSLRWMQYPSNKNTVLYLGVGITPIYACTFSILLIFAQAVFWLLFLPRGRRRDVSVLGLLVTITFLALPRILAFDSISLKSGLPFNSWFMFDLLNVPISISPAEFTQLIVLLTLAVIAIDLESPSRNNNWVRLSWDTKWPLTFPVTMLLLFALLLILFVNLPVGVMFGMASFPIVIMLSAWGPSEFPHILQAIALVACVIFAFTTLGNPMPIMAYQEIIGRTLAADTGNNARLVIAAPYVWQHLPFLHYLSADRTFHMMRDELPDSFTRLFHQYA
jgi:hypothetical protein